MQNMDVKEIPDDIDIAIVSGSVRNEDNRERLQELRKKSKTLIAYGTCACYGGITCDLISNLKPYFLIFLGCVFILNYSKLFLNFNYF